MLDGPPTTSNWDADGYPELEFRVVSGQVYDENGVVTDVGRNACAALAGQYAEIIEEALWRQVETERQDIV